MAGYVLLVLLAVLSLLDQLGAFGHRGSDWQVFDRQSFVVSQVVDGDTIRVRCNNGETPVRLIGVDAPEMPDAHWADRAKAYVDARAGGKTVTLRLEPTQTRDRYGRLLAYVYLSDSDCLNQDLVRDGQAYSDRRFKHSYRPQFELAENEARRKGRGLWKEVSEEQMPAWRRKWLRSRQG